MEVLRNSLTLKETKSCSFVFLKRQGQSAQMQAPAGTVINQFATRLCATRFLTFSPSIIQDQERRLV
jgi:hypothetical protein